LPRPYDGVKQIDGGPMAGCRQATVTGPRELEHKHLEGYMRSIRRIRTKHAAMTLGAVSAALLLAAPPAQAAGSTTVVYTDNGGSTYAGKAIFWGGYNPEQFMVCDTKADDMRVWAHWSWNGGSVTLEDADGSSAFCQHTGAHVTRKQVPEGARVEITVCRRKGADGPKKDCGFSYGKA